MDDLTTFVVNILALLLVYNGGWVVNNLTLARIYGGHGGAGGAARDRGGDGGPGQGNTINVVAKQASVNVVVNDDNTDEDKLKIVEWFSPLNFFKRHQDISSTRAPDTGQWFINQEIFQNWVNSEGGLLWCPGDPGVGKTILASIVVDHLRSVYGNAQVACIYLNYKESADQTLENLLAGLWRQLVYQKEISKLANTIYRAHKEKDTRPLKSEILALLQENTSHQCFIIVDALDECADKRQYSLMEDLSSLDGINLLVMSRPSAQPTGWKRHFQELRVHAQSDDIYHFINRFVDTTPALANQVKDHPEIREMIRNKVFEAARGMFLLAKLHMQAIEADTNLGLLKQHLSKLPQSLDKTYEEAIIRIQSRAEHDSKLAHRALLWILHAKRPLESEELVVAVAIKLRNSQYDKDFECAVDIIVAACAGLIALDIETKQVRVVHYTAQELLPKMLQYSKPHKTIAIALLTLLNGQQFKLHLEERNWKALHQKDGGALLDYAGYCLLHAQEDQQTDILDLLQTFLEQGIQWGRTMRFRVSWFHVKIWRDDEVNNPLYLAAGSNLLDVVKISIGLEGTTIAQVAAIAVKYNSTNIFKYLLEESLVGAADCTNLLQIACAESSIQVVQLLINHGTNVNLQGGTHYGSPLQAACIRGSLKIVQLLIDHGADASQLGGGDYGSPLQAACSGGNIEIVQLLVDCGADVGQLGGGDYGSPLQAACYRGNIEIVQLLIDRGADVSQLGVGDYGSPLQAACYKGHIEIVQLVIDHGADVSQLGGGAYGSPLQAACSKGNIEIVQLLVDCGADVGQLGGGAYGSPLQVACYKGHIEIVKLLIDRGADVSQFAGGHFGSPLQAACCSSNIEIVQLLVDHGADVSQLGGGAYGYPLHAACYWGRLATIQLLIAKGADIHMIGVGPYGSPLQAACAGAKLDTVQFLLAQGADVNLPGGGIYGSPLQAASSSPCYSNFEVVGFLIAHGAQVNQPTLGVYTTALDAAYYYEENEIWHYLLSCGADPLAALTTDIFH